MPDKFSYDALFAANAPEVPPGKTRHARYDFAVAYPNPDTLPLDGLADAVRSVLSREGRDLAYVEKYGSKFLTGDYTKMADSLGCHAETITQPAQIAPTLARAQDIAAGGQPVVLEIITREEPVFSRYY